MNAVFSITPRFSDKILRQEKSVELRTGRLLVPVGAFIWIYVTKPRARIEAVAQVADATIASPHTTWARFKYQLGLTKAEFDSYASESLSLTSITLVHIHVLSEPVSLAEARALRGHFHPPQRYMILADRDPLLLYLKESHSVPLTRHRNAT
jgi:predicted transcriptional regulator